MANENAKAVMSGNNHITSQLYRQIAKPNENLIYSPVSIHTVLSLVYQGATGATEKAFESVLGVADKLTTAEGYKHVMAQLNNIANVTLAIANKVYVKEGYDLRQTFQRTASKKFAAGAENIQFTDPTAGTTMNSWVEKNTQNQIKNLISPTALTVNTIMVLINAVYFKGDWADQFDKDQTRTADFFTSKGNTVPCELMYRRGEYWYRQVDKLDAQVIALPYKNPALGMLLILPNSKSGIASLEKKLATVELSTIISALYPTGVDLRLPRFKLSSTIDLNGPLKELGLGCAFGDKAEFNDLLAIPQPIYISKVLQMAVIEVNEEGAEAAAATYVELALKSVGSKPPKIIDFRADHPFICYLVYHDEDNGPLTLFHGKVAAP